MALTQQQQLVLDTITQSDVSFLKIPACAGSGKTFTLIEMAKALKPKSGLYLAYNKAIADEATEKFKGTSIKCSTIHSLAWNAVVRQYNLNIGHYSVRNVHPSTLPFRQRQVVSSLMEDFCLSAYTDPNQFLTDNRVHTRLQDVFIDNLNKLTTGELPCNHSFYLKLYHVYLANGEIPIPEVDLLLVDECADITELTIEVFKLIKATKKVAVGDPMQSIYSFNKTVNLFKTMKNEGVTVPLSESFRVSNKIAARIQGFVGNYEKDFIFTGRPYPRDAKVTTRAYISRNNSGLVEYMFHLMELGISFHTTRKVSTILELPLIIANLNNDKPVTGAKYKHIEKLRTEWKITPALQTKFEKPQHYVSEVLYKEDKELQAAFNVVREHGPKGLNAVTKYARECAKSHCDLTLTTAHSSKGLEFSSVEIAPDLNKSVTAAMIEISILESKKTAKAMERIEYLLEEVRLYYVATTRAMLELINANNLPRGLIE